MVIALPSTRNSIGFHQITHYLIKMWVSGDIIAPLLGANAAGGPRMADPHCPQEVVVYTASDRVTWLAGEQP